MRRPAPKDKNRVNTYQTAENMKREKIKINAFIIHSLSAF
jgi:hypothetical protein